MIEADRFSEWFTAIHGVEPFPWQKKLAEIVMRDGWRDALDVPTGAGKTAAIDVAVFHLAVDAARRTKDAARAPRRIFFVVDRRLVVDDAYGRAREIARALQRAESGIVLDVANALRSLQPARKDPRSVPLRVVRLRGGAPRDPDWLRSPSEPAVVVSTVDQVGSRLLFRGYGVSDPMKPVHAGLVGADALYLLDEAHLSRPLVDTVDDLFGASSLPVQKSRVYVEPFRVVTLSATQPKQGDALIGADDRRHPMLGERLRASKPAALVASDAEANTRAFRDAFVSAALAASVLGGDGGARVTCVVVNRVRRARAIFEVIEKQLREADAATGGPSETPRRVALLTGRSREIVRLQDLWTGKKDGLIARMRAPDEGVERAPLIVVATQCVEAGADLDFDALITEIAPLDCLRQRFGRLNRTGRPIESRATILAAADQVSARSKPDPVYGKALAETWKFVQRKAKKSKTGPVLDFGVDASAVWLAERSEWKECVAPTAEAPVLLPAFVDQWTRTSPVPPDHPEVALFLHGPDASPPDVQIVWRADIAYPQAKAADKDENKDLSLDWITRVSACPPSSLEALSVPFAEALRWLDGDARGDISDVEGREPGEQVGRHQVADRVLRWCGKDDERTKVLERRGDRLWPGDMIVVPASRGGCDAWGWNPASRDPVVDFADQASVVHRGRRILRLAPSLLRSRVPEPSRDAARKVRELEAFIEASSGWTDAEVRARVPDLPEELRVGWPDGLEDVDVARDEEGRALVLSVAIPKKGDAEGAVDDGAGEAVTEDDRSVSVGPRSILLADHSRGVREFATDFAKNASIPDELVDDVALAAYIHDAGKAHMAFKLWLYGGDPFCDEESEPLAKSGRKLGAKARELSGLPKGARHEVASLMWAVAHPQLNEAHDPDLVLWLVGTHHGYGRPFFTATEWPPEGDTFSVDLGDGELASQPAVSLAALQSRWFDMRERLHSKYGPWGLARLEAILRLADHRRSECEQAPDNKEGTCP